jgi:hypothetical protein
MGECNGKTWSTKLCQKAKRDKAQGKGLGKDGAATEQEKGDS